MDRSRNPERGAGRRPMPQLHIVHEIVLPSCAPTPVPRTYQVPLTDIFARPSSSEWIFTRFLDQHCNERQESMNTPRRPDRDNRVEARGRAWKQSRGHASYCTRLCVMHIYERWRKPSYNASKQMTTDPWELYDTKWPNHRNSDILGPR